MKVINFRQPLFKPNGEFFKWHYWGHIEDGFISPVAADIGKNSQQFIGKLDKNNKEICESDIVKFWYKMDVGENWRIEVVKWENYGWVVYGTENMESVKFEVIGNKIENPELLEEK